MLHVSLLASINNFSNTMSVYSFQYAYGANPLPRTIDLKNAKRPSNRAKFKKTSHWRRGKKNNWPNRDDQIGHLDMTN